MNFALKNTDGAARSGVVTTAHGAFQTPAFMPVGTQGTVKAMTPATLASAGAEIMLSNTYHLYLRPGTEVLEKAGGLHEFSAWRHPILTDSGGYQVFSLSDLRKIEEEGVTFRSHLDGSSHAFTPERVVDIQRSIGSDIMMVLDECPPFPCDRAYAAASNDLTVRWAERAKKRFASSEERYGHHQALFAIVQGSTYRDLRTESAARLTELNFEGYAIGGLAVGESAPEMYEIVGLCTGLLPALKPRYLMGVGTPENILEAIERGVDMFDCVLPTRNGRNAMVFTSCGPLTMTNARFKDDFSPVDRACECYTCANFSRSYLRHLFMAREILGLQLATLHNIHFYQWLVRAAREAIGAARFAAWKRDVVCSLRQEAPVPL